MQNEKKTLMVDDLKLDCTTFFCLIFLEWALDVIGKLTLSLHVLQSC